MLPLCLETAAAAPVEEATGLFELLLLALVQGLAEFLPISSSGHLVLARAALGVREAGLALDVALHVGTLGAVVWFYRKDVIALLTDVLRGRLALALWLVVATIPAALFGVLAGDWIEATFQTSRAAAGGLLFTAFALCVGEAARRRRGAQSSDAEEPLEPGAAPPLRLALILGLAQAVAVIPGVSRSGSTIVAGLLCGLSAQRAARASFLMSIPAILGAATMKLPDAFEAGFGGLAITDVLIAIVVSGLVGWAALRFLLLTLAKGSFPWFAGYCVVMGGLVLALA